MSGSTGNPTPLSSTGSSVSVEDSQPHRSTISPRDPIDSSLVTLQAASLTLESAYRRIRAARRNLIDASRNAEEGRQASSGIGPGHEAITLTNGAENTTDTDTSRRTSPATSVAQSRARFQAVQEQLRQIEATIDTEIRRRSIQYGEPVSSNAAASPPRPVASSNSNVGVIGSQRPSLGSLRTTNLDGGDGSTSLGRRVALREMASSITSPSSSTSASSLRLEQTMDTLASISERVEAFDSLRRQLNSHADLPPQSPPTSSTPSSGVESTHETRRRSMYVARSSTRSDTSSSSAADLSRRRRLYGSTTTTSSSLSQSPLTSESDPRLSLLSNFSVQNLPTPVSGSSPRALIFEEPTSYIPAANFIEPTSNTRSEPIRESQDERSYVVRRRYNADGEEVVHSINMEWADDDDDDPMAWMLSRDSQEDLGLDAVNNRVGGPRPRRRHVNHANPVGRRRTWVRLDADGDEIVDEEPVDLERPAYQIRINPRPYAPIPASFLESQETMPLLAADQRMDVPRVRVPRPPGIAQSDSNSTVRPDASPKNSSFQHASFYSNPLPMPVESMVQLSQRAKPKRVVTLPKHALFACR